MVLRTRRVHINEPGLTVPIVNDSRANVERLLLATAASRHTANRKPDGESSPGPHSPLHPPLGNRTVKTVSV